MAAVWSLAAALLLPALLGGGCNDGEHRLVAKKIESTGELIGGPSAKGKVGDLLLENDQLRAIVAGEGQTWLGSTFGGSLIDIDRVRPHRKGERNGQGHDSFGETFPLVNLLVADPSKPVRRVENAEGSLEVTTRLGGVTVVNDGSSGDEAIVRVSGSGAYLFQAIKFLNRDFLRTMLAEFKLGDFPLPLRDLGKFIDPNLDLYSLLNRLQLDFSFTTDYIVRPGQAWITIRTTVDVAPPSDAVLAQCAAVRGAQPPCALTACPGGLALEQVDAPQASGAPVPLFCPVCRCAAVGAAEMANYTEQRNIFGDILGDLDQWTDADWRGGIVGGDFLFFGGQASIFIPGEGFDDERRVFEDMWQGIGSLAAPFVYPWLAATGENVSYGFTSVNPQARPAQDCRQQRPAIATVSAAGEAAVVQALQTGFGMTPGAASGLVRGNIVDHNPIPLPVPAITLDQPLSARDYEVWRQQEVGRWLAAAEATWTRAAGVEPGEISGLPRLAAEDAAQVRQALEGQTTLALLPAQECLSAQMLVPIFTSSATAVMTHHDAGNLTREQGRVQQDRLQFTWERYLAVGDGDVGSVLQTIYTLRGEPMGWVQGAVYEDGSTTPVRHAHVLAVRDPRPDTAQPTRFASWDALRRATQQAFGNRGVVSDMQSDLGLDDVHDGDYRGPLPPGRYYLVAKTADRRASRPVPVTIAAGKTVIAHPVIEAAGKLVVRVQDQAGQRLPAKVVLVDTDDQGVELRWDGQGQVALGDSRFDLGFRRAEFTVDGMVEMTLEAGHYHLYVSRGLEYSVFYRDIEVEPGEPVFVEAMLRHEVDTAGQIAGDFHIHTRASVDGSMPIDERVRSAAAEGVEFITGTDHDTLVDYSPYIDELSLQPFLASQVGVETTTLEFGHFNGYPLRYRHTDWSVHDPPPWYGLPTDEVFDELRRRAADPDDFVVQVNHPYDGFMGYLAQSGVRGYDLQRATPGMEMCNPQTEQISCDFDALEVMNEKRFELIRTPTVREVADHNRCYQEILAAHEQTHYPLSGGSPGGVVCGWLQVGPEGCETVAQQLAQAPAGEARDALLDLRDRCDWAAALRRGFGQCNRPGISLIECKRSAIDALKYHSVRQMMDRTAQEQEAFRTLTAELDPECNLENATKGCSENRDATGKLLSGCGGTSCLCQPCVCGAHPECCKTEAAGGTGWTAACADACRDECNSCGVQPCTDKTQMLDSWFTMLNQGFNVTAMGNSDSHNKVKEIGIPRNFVRVGDDAPRSVSRREVNQAIRQHRVTATTGPYVEATIAGGEIGDTVLLPGGQGVAVRVRVQTPSWFGVDRLEIYRNGRLEKRLRLEQPPEAIVDFDGTIQLPRPAEDSWYVVVAYGLGRGSDLSPPYGGLIYGHLLIPTVISVGLGQILGGFDSLMARLEEKGLGAVLETMLSGAAGGTELPDSFPTLPFGVTNPVWVDVDGGGFAPPEARDADEDGLIDLPAFCTQPCTVQVDPVSGLPLQGSCGTNQVCQPADASAADGVGRCAIPLPASCPADLFGSSNGLPAGLATSRAALEALGPADPPWSASRVVEHLLRANFWGAQH